MEIVVQRLAQDPDSTLGHMTVDGKHAGFTLEDEARKVKIMNETRIPAGRYEIKLREESGMAKRYRKKFGDKHKGMLWLQDVPNFEWIYIHIGNTENHTSGCLLVAWDALSSGSPYRIGNSTDCYLQLAGQVYDALDLGDRVWITLKDEVM